MTGTTGTNPHQERTPPRGSGGGSEARRAADCISSEFFLFFLAFRGLRCLWGAIFRKHFFCKCLIINTLAPFSYYFSKF